MIRSRPAPAGSIWRPGPPSRFDSDVFAGFMSGTASATLAAGPIARLDAPGLLEALDRYPYGCTEQVTSRALPLVVSG